MCLARREQGQLLIVYRITGSKPEDDEGQSIANAQYYEAEILKALKTLPAEALLWCIGDVCRQQVRYFQDVSLPCHGPILL